MTHGKQAWIAPLVLVLAGCSGSVESLGGGDGGPGQDSGGQDTGTQDSGAKDTGAADGQPGPDATPFDASGPDASPWSPVCPASAPAPGAPCTVDQLQCEYGGAWWSVSCDTVMQCQMGQWTVAHPSFDPCSPQPGPNSGACPADYGAVQQGASCDVQTSCYYPQGVCACQQPLGGVPQLDAGAYWGCLPDQGCPWPRPRLGTACSGASAYCTYESCSYGQSCTNGVWQGQAEACGGVAGLGGP